VGVVQLCSTAEVDANLARAAEAIETASERGAQLVALPEAFAFLQREGTAVPCAQAPDGRIVRFLAEQAHRHGVWLVGGSLPEAIPGSERVYNTCLVLRPDGSVAARYRKIHLFDADLGDRGGPGHGAYRESARTAPGEQVVAAETPFGPIGLSICYDLRFPELYRRLCVAHGARWLFVPSAFTPETGKDHWEVLLRARAIESQCYVIAPAQCGRHGPDRASHGRSMVVDPWGLVRARAADEPIVLVVDCPEEEVERVRRAVPALANRRLQP